MTLEVTASVSCHGLTTAYIGRANRRARPLLAWSARAAGLDRSAAGAD